MKQGDAERPISHGICDACSRSTHLQAGLELREYLNTLEAPVVAVDSDAVVKVANDKACGLFGKDVASVVGRTGGDVFECIHASEPGGCGGTVHCSACAIRKTVTDTFTSGKPSIRVPAFLKQGPTGRQGEIALYISTEKVGDVVFLRIDRVGKK
jgi:PAS domain-containing protein